jgi:Domain of unknown function (DUF222)
MANSSVKRYCVLNRFPGPAPPGRCDGVVMMASDPASRGGDGCPAPELAVLVGGPALPGDEVPDWWSEPAPDVSRPPQYADLSLAELLARLDAEDAGSAPSASEGPLAAGFLPRPASPGPGFVSGGAADRLDPGPCLAGLAEAACRGGGLAALNDDELIGAMKGWARLESWGAAGLLAAVAELARRRPADRTPPAAGPGEFPARLSPFIADEIAAALTVTGRAADGHLDLGLDLAVRLPATMQALTAGRIDRPRAKVIADLTRVLTAAHARQAEQQILDRMGNSTTGQLRALLARVIIAIDPEAARRRREEAQRDPRVRRWQEDAGTAALAGFGLPPADVLAADQQLTHRALDLRAAGLAGSLEELRARAYLDALLGRDSQPAPASDQASDHHSPSGQPRPPSDQPRPPNGQPRPPTPQSASAGPAEPGSRHGEGLAARVNLTASLATVFGVAEVPGNLTGFGPLDPALTRDLATRAAAHPASRWCLTITGDHGHAIAHACLPGQPFTPGDRAGPLALAGRKITITLRPVTTGPCGHDTEEARYQPSRALQHLVAARTNTCVIRGCRSPAARCDLDHTVPYDQGGRTCECNLAPLCRHHHRAKQAHGWRLEQPEPGVFTWSTPSGRVYTTGPTEHVV